MQYEGLLTFQHFIHFTERISMYSPSDRNNKIFSLRSVQTFVKTYYIQMVVRKRLSATYQKLKPELWIQIRLRSFLTSGLNLVLIWTPWSKLISQSATTWTINHDYLSPRGRPVQLWQIQQTLGRGDFIEVSNILHVPFLLLFFIIKFFKYNK